MLRAAALFVSVVVAIAAPDRGTRELVPGGVRGYLVKVSRPSAIDDGEATRVLTRVLGDGWQALATAIPGELRVVAETADARRDVARTSFASAWEIVHRLRRSGEFSRAEPLFARTLEPLAAQDLPNGECAPAWTGEWNEPPKDDPAVKDSQWSLGPQGANVLAAWQLFGKDTIPGDGVIVGHPDTGYRPHPTLAKVLLGKGFDFTANRSDALDVSDEGKLQWPGHGTRTGSVIAGSTGYRVTADGVRAVSGVAPGAKLMPLKVAHRVVLFDRLDLDMGNLASAIHAASIGDPNYVRQKAQVISISLGGAPSRSVQEAVALAREQNVIVIAAAGNQVPRFLRTARREVVWPARYDDVIAIAASNASQQPWEGTSEGPKVAVSAPGQSVWVASQNRTGEVSYDCVQMSTGTSYATATTAGVAALWLSYRKKDLIDRSVASYPVEFDRILRATARDPGSWNMSRHGAGILDALAVLKADIGSEPPARAAEQCEDAAAVGSLFARRGAYYAAWLLFGSSAARCGGFGHLGDEVAHLFSIEPAIQTAFAHFNDAAMRGDAIADLRSAIESHQISITLRRALRTAARSDAAASAVAKRRMTTG